MEGVRKAGGDGLGLPLGNSQAGLPTTIPEHPGRWELADGRSVLSQTSTDWGWGWELDTGPERVRCLAWIAELRKREVVLEPRLASLQGCKAHFCLKQRSRRKLIESLRRSS